MKVGICVPYRDRERYLPIFLRETDAYLRRHYPDLKYGFFVGEQISPGLFNAAAARNLAVKAAIDAGCSDLVLMDVDVIPVCGIDWKPPTYPEVWFMHSGGSRMPVAYFLACNGWNISFAGWGDEDTDFYHRLSVYGSPQGWRESLTEDQCQAAMICNLEFEFSGTPEEQEEASRRHARRWWKQDLSFKGPWFMSWEMLQRSRGRKIIPLERHNRAGWYDIEVIERNQAHWKWLYKELASEQYREYCQKYGYRQCLDLPQDIKWEVSADVPFIRVRFVAPKRQHERF